MPVPRKRINEINIFSPPEALTLPKKPRKGHNRKLKKQREAVRLFGKNYYCWRWKGRVEETWGWDEVGLLFSEIAGVLLYNLMCCGCLGYKAFNFPGAGSNMVFLFLLFAYIFFSFLISFSSLSLLCWEVLLEIIERGVVGCRPWDGVKSEQECTRWRRRKTKMRGRSWSVDVTFKKLSKMGETAEL